MDAVEFLKAWKRMCDHKEEGYCRTCEVRAYCRTSSQNAEKLVEVVEVWAKEHPVKTRQSEFLKMFPKVKTVVIDNREVVLAICPKQIDSTITLPSCVGRKCVECEKDYWLQEVE